MYLGFSAWNLPERPEIPESNRAAVCIQIPVPIPAFALRLLSQAYRKGLKDEKKYYLSAIFFQTYHCLPMESVDQQLWQLKENYARMTEGELGALAEDAYDLTTIAREALQAVISERGIADID